METTFLMKQKIAAVIVSFNQKEALIELLGKLYKLKGSESMDILLVLNGCTDGTEEMLDIYKDSYASRLSVFVLQRNCGGAGGFRKGMEEALKKDYSHIWLMDDDIVPREDALDALLQQAESLERWGALGSLVARKEDPGTVTETGGEIAWWKGKLTCHNGGASLEETVKREAFSVGHCAAASLLVNRKAVEKLGFFEDIFIHFDDVEWCYRLARGGFPVFTVPSSVVWHPYKRGRTPAWIRYYDARNILLVYKRNRPGLLFIPWMRFRLMALVFLLKRDRTSARAIRLGQKDFFSHTIRYRDELLSLL